ncbi:MAG: undecaprenyl-diphosphatase, partial [Tenuifilum sp.]|uniref:phosphatase PAP2 family protein n=1 Tax=Tenuifilum sp. TaxID=2760880 RepID=UPI0024AB6A10
LSLLYKSRWASVGLIAWAAFVSYSRIYLGVHYPGDVLCGALLGSLIGFLVWKFSSNAIMKQISKTKK